MKTSAEGRRAIRSREGDKLKAYLDSVGVWTIGVGHTTAAGPPTVTKGMTITAEASASILERDLAGVEADVNKVKVSLTQDQFDALVSLVFNIGGPKFKKSTLLAKLNSGDYAGAADQFLRWNKGTVNGKLTALKGLTTRRQAERAQFLTGAAAQQAPKPAKAAPAGAVSTIQIRLVQERLRDLGYSEAGTPDGILGKMTKTAILAFRNEHGLPLSDTIDDALMTALDGARSRNLPRNDAKPAEIRAAAPEVQSNWLTKLGAGAGAGAAGIAGAGDAILDKISPWKAAFADVPTWVWLGLAAGVFLVIFLIAQRGEKKGIEAFQSGERR